MRHAQRLLFVLTSTTLLLALAGVAFSAATLRYSGKTSQQRRISFTVSGGAVRNLQFHIVDKCPRHWTLFVWDHGIPPLPITHSRFGHQFRNKSGNTVRVSGQTHGRAFTGTVQDRTKSNKIHRYCSGRATFKLRPS